MPRYIVEGSTYFITRRTILRYFLLRPDALLTNLILFVLSFAAKRFYIQVHAICAMSDHIHLVVTDTTDKLPKFLGYFHRIVALGTQIFRKWEGSVFDSGDTSIVRLETRQAIIEKIAYTLANPVAAGLVERACEWPGATVRVEDLGRGVLCSTLPGVYFSRKNPLWPKEATLELTLPPGIAPEEADGFRAAVAALVEREEAKMKGLGTKVLGAENAMKVSHLEQATSEEAKFERNPTFATGSDTKEERARAVEVLQTFREAYRAAIVRWHKRERDVRFPVGTWWMRVFHGALVVTDTPIS